MFYALVVGMAFGTLSEVIGELQRAAGAAERIGELLQARNEIRAPKTDLLIPCPQRISGRLALENVSFAYPARPERNAVDNLTLSVERDAGAGRAVRGGQVNDLRPAAALL